MDNKSSTDTWTMNVSNNGDEYPNHMLYKLYNGAGPVWALILPALLMNMAGVPGILCNLLLILVTIRNKSLRGSTNFLLALTAFFEILHQSTHFVFLFITVSGINFVPYYLALRFQLHSIFGVLAAQMAMMATAVDRFISVVFPLTYPRLNGPLYLGVYALASVASGGFISWWTWRFSLSHPFLPVTGYISDLLVLDVELIFVCIQAMCAVNIALYALIWIIFKRSAASSSQLNCFSQQLFKSLVVIIGIVIGGYMLNNVCRLVVNHWFHLDDVQQWRVAEFGGVILNIGASAETPILYMFSTDYRKAIDKEFARALCYIFGHRKACTVVVKADAEEAMAEGGRGDGVEMAICSMGTCIKVQQVPAAVMVSVATAGGNRASRIRRSFDIGDIRRHSQLSAVNYYAKNQHQRRKSSQIVPVQG